jgi:hypothetical protein
LGAWEREMRERTASWRVSGQRGMQRGLIGGCKPEQSPRKRVERIVKLDEA